MLPRLFGVLQMVGKLRLNFATRRGIDYELTKDNEIEENGT